MILLDEIGEAIASTGKTVLQKTKNLTELSRLNAQLAEERQEAERRYAAIGRRFYEQREGVAEEPYQRLFARAAASQARMEKLEARLQQVKGARPCLSCGKEIPFESHYCLYCGVKSDPPAVWEEKEPVKERHCPACGAVLPESGMFCSFCGASVCSPPPEAEEREAEEAAETPENPLE